MLAGFSVLQLLLVATGFSGWQCPIRETLGVTCPGCGMTSALVLLLKGHWQIAFKTHAFAPVILLALMLMTTAVVLPASYLGKLADRMDRLERKSGIAAILLLGMVFYWLLRVFEII